MPSLDEAFGQLAERLRGPGTLGAAQSDPFFYFVYAPQEALEVKRKLPVWTANLNRWDGTEPNRRLSLWSDSGLEKPHPHNPKRFGELLFSRD